MIDPIAVLHTEKQAFQYAVLQSWESCLGIRLQCSYMHSRAIQCNQAPYIAILRKLGKGRRVHMCAWAENIANVWLPYTNIWEVP